ncbi:MAG: hypothetical protein IPG75_14690 [Gemmatimonadetes bacterium]|nr:hypothetical protein [Gemmatimonadota bacterium]
MVHRMAGDTDRAADWTQRLLVRVFARLRDFRGEAALGTWIGSIAISVALTSLRQVERRSERETLEDYHPARAERRADRTWPPASRRPSPTWLSTTGWCSCCTMSKAIPTRRSPAPRRRPGPPRPGSPAPAPGPRKPSRLSPGGHHERRRTGCHDPPPGAGTSSSPGPRKSCGRGSRPHVRARRYRR